MSGGHFCGNSYPYYLVWQFADELESRIENNDRPDEYGYCPKFSEETLLAMRNQIALLRRTAAAMRAIDYLYSGDYGEDILLRALEKAKNEGQGAPTLPDHRGSTKVKLDELRERAARICELYGPALEGPILAQKIRSLPDLE